MIDEFLNDQVKYLQGKLRIINAKFDDEIRTIKKSEKCTICGEEVDNRFTCSHAIHAIQCAETYGGARICTYILEPKGIF